MQIEQQEIVNQGIVKNDEEQNDLQHKNLNHNSLYYSFMERYFSNYENNHQYLHMHSNGICIIAVKREGLHSPPKQITEFIEVSEVRGKKKKGGIRVKPDTLIAKIICEDGTEVKIMALIEGTILQKNQTLTLQSIGKPSGFFIIILPFKKIVPQKLGMKRIVIDHLGQ